MVMGDMQMSTDLLVIGGGPGGYSAAFRGAELGLDVILVDQRPQLGGLCLHSGCIPSKTLLQLTRLLDDTRQAAQKGLRFGRPEIDLAAIRSWQQKVIGTKVKNLMDIAKERGVLVVGGRARFAGSGAVRLEGAEMSGITFKKAIIATGSRPRPLAGSGFTPGGGIMNSTAALLLTEVPKTLVVVGGGCVGLEIGSIYATLGSRVTLMEMQDRLLPKADADLVAPLHARLQEKFADIHCGAHVEGLTETGAGVAVRYSRGGKTAELIADRVLLALGRVPNSDDLGLERTAVSLDDHGFIEIDDQLRTTDPRIFAAGDVAGGILLAHKAARQGRTAAEVIGGWKTAFDVRAIPAVVYTEPQLAWCGLTEAEAVQENIDYAVSHHPACGDRSFAKVLTNPDDGRILGVGIVGDQAEGYIGEAALAIEMGALAEDLALVLHPFPALAGPVGDGDFS